MYLKFLSNTVAFKERPAVGKLAYTLKSFQKARPIRFRRTHKTLLSNVVKVFCRLFPFFPQPPRQCLGPTCHLSTLTDTVSPVLGTPKKGNSGPFFILSSLNVKLVSCEVLISLYC
jgi:hypothetical protein